MFDCRCIHKDNKIVLSSLVDDEILRIKTEIERKEIIIKRQVEKGKRRSELLESSYVTVANEEINQLNDLRRELNQVSDC